MKCFLLAALCVMSSVPTVLCCFNEYVEKDRKNTFNCTFRDSHGRIVVITKKITSGDLNTGVPVADHVKRRVKEYYELGDIIDTVIDPKLGGSGEEIRNVIPMNYQTHLLWRVRVTNRIYSFLQETLGKDLWFRVELFYYNAYESRPFFLGVRCGFCNPPFDSSCTRELPYYGQYLIYGFIYNPSSRYQYFFDYDAAEYVPDFFVPREPVTSYLYSVETSTLKGPTQYVMTGNLVDIHTSRNITRVESTWKDIKVADLVTLIGAKNTTANIEKKRTEGSGFVGDIPGELISPELGGSGEYNVVQMTPEARITLNNIVMVPIARYLKNIRHKDHTVYLRIDLMYNDSLTSRPVGFLVSTSVKVKLNSSGGEIITHSPHLQGTTFVYNIPNTGNSKDLLDRELFKHRGFEMVRACTTEGKREPSLLTKLKEIIFGRPPC